MDERNEAMSELVDERMNERTRQSIDGQIVHPYMSSRQKVDSDMRGILVIKFVREKDGGTVKAVGNLLGVQELAGITCRFTVFGTHLRKKKEKPIMSTISGFQLLYSVP